MSDLEWSRLLKQQDQHVHEEDRREQQRKLRIKQLYKAQLQKMIQHHQSHMHDEKDQDKRMVQWLNLKQRRRMAMQEQLQAEKHRIKQQMARQNLKSTQFKKQRIVNESQQTKKFYGSRYRKVMTEVEEQTKSRLKHRQQQKNKLSKAYDSQIKFHKNRMILQKMEDQKFAQLRDQIQRKKEESRKQFFQRVRIGYRQNPEVYDLSSAALKQRQKQRNDFLKKIVSEDQQSIVQKAKMKEEQQKLQKVKQTSSFNRNSFQNKAYRQRYQSLQQISEYNRKYRTLQQQMQIERQRQLRETQEKKRMLKKELQKQIDQSHNKIYFRNRLNDKEIQLNKNNQIPASLPGLSKDYAAQKQQRILQNFLQGGSAKKIQYTI